MKDSSRQIARKSVEAIVEKQGLDPVVLDVRELTDIADYFIIASGRTDRQVEAIQEAILENLKEAGFRPLGVEGKRGGETGSLWITAEPLSIFLPPKPGTTTAWKASGSAPPSTTPSSSCILFDHFHPSLTKSLTSFLF